MLAETLCLSLYCLWLVAHLLCLPGTVVSPQCLPSLSKVRFAFLLTPVLSSRLGQMPPVTAGFSAMLHWVRDGFLERVVLSSASQSLMAMAGPGDILSSLSCAVLSPLRWWCSAASGQMREHSDGFGRGRQ